MDKREEFHRDAQEAYARRNSSLKAYVKDPANTTQSQAEQERIQQAEERAAYLARRKARLEQIAAAEAAKSPEGTEEPE